MQLHGGLTFWSFGAWTLQTREGTLATIKYLELLESYGVRGGAALRNRGLTAPARSGMRSSAYWPVSPNRREFGSQNEFVQS